MVIVTRVHKYTLKICSFIFQVFPLIDAAEIGIEGWSQAVVSELLDGSFEIRKIRENLKEEFKSLVSNITISIVRNVTK